MANGTDEVILIRSYNKSKKDIYVIHIYDLFTMQGDKVLEAFSYKRDPIQKKPVFLPGDFNGDGKTEIIERVIDASTGYYNMYAHTGSGYKSLPEITDQRVLYRTTILYRRPRR